MKTLKDEAVTTYDKQVALNKSDLVDILVENGFLKGKEANGVIEIYVKVPSGGDYSNASLDIDDDCPLIIKTKYSEIT